MQWSPTRRRYFQADKKAHTSYKASAAGFVPEILNRNAYDEVIHVKNDDALETACRSARGKKVFCRHLASGATLWTALQVAQRPKNKEKLIVAIVPSFGERYLSTTLFAGLSD
ncbi:hypothetical protein [Candidatus Methylospira mobilis]|nr:hypothetical protein [Candidatus Methylospira mobilis]